MPEYKQKIKYLIRVVPLAVIDVFATVVAVLVAAWGTQTEDLVVDSINFVPHLLLLAVVNLIVFACFRMYNSMWEYASVDDAARILVATIVGSLVGDVLGALLFGGRLPFRVYFCAWAILFVLCSLARFLIRVNSHGRSWSFFGISSPGLPRTLIVVRVRVAHS